MSEDQTQKENKDKGQEIKIDYDNIDVADIMDQIKKRIAAQPKKIREPLLEHADYGPFQDPWIEIPPDEVRTKSRIKNLLLKIMRPFSPLIKLAVLPVHHELTETIKKLDVTNRKVNYLREKLDHDLGQLGDSLNAKIEDLDSAVNKRLDLAFDDIGRIKEYTRLLHSISHNIVVELTKLKIEEENHKIKSRILEKDFEFLEKRERALEAMIARH